MLSEYKDGLFVPGNKLDTFVEKYKCGGKCSTKKKPKKCEQGAKIEEKKCGGKCKKPIKKCGDGDILNTIKQYVSDFLSGNRGATAKRVVPVTYPRLYGYVTVNGQPDVLTTLPYTQDWDENGEPNGYYENGKYWREYEIPPYNTTATIRTRVDPNGNVQKRDTLIRVNPFLSQNIQNLDEGVANDIRQQMKQNNK